MGAVSTPSHHGGPATSLSSNINHHSPLLSSPLIQWQRVSPRRLLSVGMLDINFLIFADKS